MTEADDDKRNMVNDIIAKRKEGIITVSALEGLLCFPAKKFVEQGKDGILYDLNRLPEIALSNTDDPRWVNDYATTETIKILVEQRDGLRGILQILADYCQAIVKECEDCTPIMSDDEETRYTICQTNYFELKEILDTLAKGKQDAKN